MAADSLSEGLRARKKRLMRQLISDTATEMMLERGFDEVRVADVAEAVGVSEKTVYNYFPTKESLILDREEDWVVAIRRALGPGAPDRSPVEAAVEVIRRDLDDMRRKTEQELGEDVIPFFHRFLELLDTTPSLRAAQGDMVGRLVQVAAEALAERAGVNPEDPEPQIAADALLGLWRIQHTAMRRHAVPGRSLEEVHRAVSSEVDRAARLIDSGLWSFGVMVGGNGGREQLKAAAVSAQAAGRQVAAALAQARAAWAEVRALHEAHEMAHATHGAVHGTRQAAHAAQQAEAARRYGAGVKRQVAQEVKRRIREEMQAQKEERTREQRRLAEEMRRASREHREAARRSRRPARGDRPGEPARGDRPGEPARGDRKDMS